MRGIPNYIMDQIPTHLSPRVQTLMRIHLMKEHHRKQEEHQKANHLLENLTRHVPLLEHRHPLPDQDLNMETELMFMYHWGES